MRRRRFTLPLLGARLVAALVGVAALGLGSAGDDSGSNAPRDGLDARFAYLSGQRSNRCDLEAQELLSRPAGGRLQGACCSPMERQAYGRQVRALRRYAAIEQIPTDPYDVSVALAQQLLRYRVEIDLLPGQYAVYRRAMGMSREKGPCCCRCWRWSAFEGLSRYLIARRDWRPEPLARLIEALDGCGGDSRHS